MGIMDSGLVMEMASEVAMRKVGVGELGWKWPTAVLTLSCELAPNSC